EERDDVWHGESLYHAGPGETGASAVSRDLRHLGRVLPDRPGMDPGRIGAIESGPTLRPTMATHRRTSEISPMAIDAEQLLRHSEWARALARHLVGDAADAEDIVQEAWIAALASPAPKGALRPWLAGVIRKLALM